MGGGWNKVGEAFYVPPILVTYSFRVVFEGVPDKYEKLSCMEISRLNPDGSGAQASVALGIAH